MDPRDDLLQLVNVVRNFKHRSILVITCRRKQILENISERREYGYVSYSLEISNFKNYSRRKVKVRNAYDSSNLTSFLHNRPLNFQRKRYRFSFFLFFNRIVITIVIRTSVYVTVWTNYAFTTEIASHNRNDLNRKWKQQWHDREYSENRVDFLFEGPGGKLSFAGNNNIAVINVRVEDGRFNRTIGVLHNNIPSSYRIGRNFRTELFPTAFYGDVTFLSPEMILLRV